MANQLTATPAISNDPIRAAPRGAGRLGRFATRYGGAARRFVTVAAVAFWLGGFTFYAGVAIPMGVEVLGSHRKVGFITQHVTNWLNVAGVCALVILLGNLLLAWNARGKFTRYALLVTWLLMAAIEIELICLHPAMDRLIGFVAPTPGATPIHTILDEDRFELLHHIYLGTTTAQWCLGVIHVWLVCLVWQPARPAEER